MNQYEKYIEENCNNCINRKTDLCEIIKMSNGILRCLNKREKEEK